MFDSLLILLKKLTKNIYIHLPIILLIIGIICFVANLYIENEVWVKITGNIANITLVSALLSFLTNTAKYMHIFQDALTDVIYDHKFLSKRKDIDRIWENVSESMFKSKFPQIKHDLLDTVKNNYLPPDQDVSFYQDYKYIVEINFDEHDHNIIHVKNKISFTLVAQDDKKFKFESTNKICTSGEQREYKCTSFKVNDQAVTPTQSPSTIHDNLQVTTLNVELEGKTKYQIEEVIEKTYSIIDDNFICFRAKWLIKNMTVQIFLPPNISIKFINCALEDKFRQNNNGNFWEFEYKGLLLRHQGFLIILNPKNLSYEQDN